MKIASWNDGSVIEIDPRREDPLLYYLKDREWASSVGFEALPLYEEHRSVDVTLGIWRDHIYREAALDDDSRQQMYLRVIPALATFFKNWKRITVRLPKTPDITEALSSKLGFMKFSSSPSDLENSVCYERG